MARWLDRWLVSLGDCLQKTSQNGIYFSGAAGWLVIRDYKATEPPQRIYRINLYSMVKPYNKEFTYGDGNENVKEQLVKISKTTTLYVHHAFLYISLSSLHDYDVNCLISREHTTTNLS